MRDTASTPLLSPERADASIRVLRAPSPRVGRAAPDGTGATPSARARHPVVTIAACIRGCLAKLCIRSGCSKSLPGLIHSWKLSPVTFGWFTMVGSLMTEGDRYTASTVSERCMPRNKNTSRGSSLDPAQSTDDWPRDGLAY